MIFRKKTLRKNNILFLPVIFVAILAAFFMAVPAFSRDDGNTGIVPKEEKKTADGKKKHSMLLLPPENTHASDIQRDISIHPTCNYEFYLSGRYLDAVKLPGKLLAVACIRGVDFFDVSGPGKIVPAGTVDTPGHAWSVITVEDYLWVADGYHGVSVIDWKAKKNVYSWRGLSNARAFCRTPAGDVIVCRHASGATLISSHVQRDPDVLAELPVAGRVMWASCKGTIAYLGTIGGGYHAVDISDPRHPRRMWSVSGPKKIIWNATIDGWHYLADRNEGLWVLKDSPSGAPEIARKIPVSPEIRRGVIIDQRFIALAVKNGCIVWDATPRDNPEKMETLKCYDQGWSVLYSGGTLYLSNGDRGMIAYRWNASEKKLEKSAQFDRWQLLTDVAVAGDYVLAASTFSGLQVARMSSDGELTPVADLKNMYFLTGIDVQGDIAGVVNYRGFMLVDISKLPEMKILGKLKTPGRASGVCLAGNLALVADWFKGLEVIDITDRNNPVIISTVEHSGWAIDVLYRKPFAYIGFVNGGLVTVDLSDPRNPEVISNKMMDVAPEGLAVKDNILYVADFNAGLVLFDISNPGHPSLVKNIPADVGKGVQVKDDLLVLANYIYGIKLFDISDRENPVLIGELDTPGKAYEVAFSPRKKNTLFVADWYALLQVEW